MPSLVEIIRARALPTAIAFWRWWIGELGELLPTLPKFLNGNASRVDIRPGRDRVELVRTSRSTGERLIENTPLASFSAENWAELAELTAAHRTRIVLAFPQIYWLSLTLPRAARSRLASAVALQLRDHAPLESSLLDWRVGKVRAMEGRLVVEVVLVRLSLLESVANDFARHDLPIPPIFAERSDGSLLWLRPGVGANGLAVADLRTALAICLILLSTPFLALAVDTLLVRNIGDKVMAAQEAAQPRLAAERRLRAKADVGKALNVVLAAPSITEIVEGLAREMPQSVHAIDIAAHDDNIISFTLEAPNPDVVSTIFAHDPYLTGIRELERAKADDTKYRLRFEARLR